MLQFVESHKLSVNPGNFAVFHVTPEVVKIVGASAPNGKLNDVRIPRLLVLAEVPQRQANQYVPHPRTFSKLSKQAH